MENIEKIKKSIRIRCSNCDNYTLPIEDNKVIFESNYNGGYKIEKYFCGSCKPKYDLVVSKTNRLYDNHYIINDGKKRLISE